ncbi:MAG: inositol monophosphatase family protein [Caldilineaceae bacterium]|nr:inositol monophosphatase family protein [Caldilineaceae bacterium]
MPKSILSPSEHSALIEFIRLLADESGAIIRRYFRSGYTVDSKSDETPVTIADRQAEERMRELIGQHFPSHGILGEEYGHHQPDAPFQWVLDPIDGTKNFISHGYLFGTLIALVHEQKALLGAIHQPILQDLLIGDGETAWLNRDPVRVRDCPSIDDAVFLTTDHYNVANFHNGPAFEQVAQRAAQYRTWGDCHGYYLVAVGGADVMTDPVMNFWDRAALVPIIEGAGGRITDWQGGDPLYGSGVIATGGTIHDELIQLLNP